MKIILIILIFSSFVLGQNKVVVNKLKTTTISKNKINNITRNKHNIIISQNAGDFYDVDEALDVLTGTLTIPYNLYVDMGTYHYTQASDFKHVISGFHSMFRTEDYINIYGAGIDKTIFYGELPDTTILNLGFYSTIDLYGTQILNGFTVKAKNIKYAVHDDFGSTNDSLIFNKVKFIHEGCMNYYNYWLPTIKTYYWCSYGNGMSSGRVINFNECVFDGQAGFHTNKNFPIKTKLTFNNCRFISRNYNPTSTYTTGLNLESLQSLKEDSVYLNNCTLDSMLYDWYVYQSDTSLIPYDLAEIKVININSNYVFNNRGALNTSNGSLMFIATDSIRFISGSLLVRNSINLGDSLIAKLEVGEHSLSPNTKMSIRLGDCSLVNKTIELVINGTPQTITFNEDFTGKTNTYILNFINTQLINATAKLYSWALKYNL